MCDHWLVLLVGLVGCNPRHCRLGTRDNQARACRIPEQYFGGAQIVRLVTGSESSVAVTANHTMFAWGWNEHGMLRIIQPISKYTADQ
jgi:alpha-tubulin suppressor-like RCC1 family protein